MRRKRERGTALSETVVLLPLLLLLVIVCVDFGRMVYTSQVLIDLTREAANLVSRGSTTTETFTAILSTSREYDIVGKGGMIISQVERRSATDPTPWVMSQDRRGSLGGSRVGSVNGPAKVPNVKQLEVGITVFAVEVEYPFTPIFKTGWLGLNPYPTSIYDAAYF